MTREEALTLWLPVIKMGVEDMSECNEALEMAIKALEQEPKKPKTGHWSHDGSHWKNRFICSECGYKLFDEPTSYCPNCGAKMQEIEE